MGSVEGFFAALGIKFAVLVSSAIGGFLSLRFFEGERLPDGAVRPLTLTHKWAIAGSGTALGIYLSGFAVEVFALTDKTGKVEVGLGIIIGLFGMSAAASVVKLLRDGDILESWLKRR